MNTETPQYVVIEFNGDKADEINKLIDAKDFDGLLAHPHEITSTYPSLKGFKDGGRYILKPLDDILQINRTANWIKTKSGVYMGEIVSNDTTPDYAICFRVK